MLRLIALEIRVGWVYTLGLKTEFKRYTTSLHKHFIQTPRVKKMHYEADRNEEKAFCPSKYS
jgi:hypothetical protein